MEKGRDILLKTYWSSNGWKDGSISSEDFETAKKQGFMFDYPDYATHDETIDRLRQLLSEIHVQDVANAFLYSLSTRKPEYRSALGSFYYAKAIPEHSATAHTRCHICGWRAWEREPSEYDKKRGLNVFNFERYKWGGVRQTHLDYALFDLEQFLKLPKVTPTDKDREILGSMLTCMEKLEPHDKVGKLRDLIVSHRIFPCNKSEVSVILDILGICGILACQDHPSYEDRFADEYHRDPIEMKNDFQYPVNRWSACDGMDHSQFEKVFRYRID